MSKDKTLLKDGQEAFKTSNIHNVSEVNNPAVHLSDIEGPAHSGDFNHSGDHVNGSGESTQWGMKK